MKLSHALLFVHLTLLSLLCSISTIASAEPAVSLKSPPASLEKWYKPANKRQVWLHTMFRLRREMQAIAEYAEIGNQQAKSISGNREVLDKWIKRLDKDYNKIAEMIPEWKNEIKPRLVEDLSMFAEKGDRYRIDKTLKMIERTCNDCHTYYQPLVTAIYRSPDYKNIEIKDSNGNKHSFKDNMEQLSASVNRILIALDDGHNTVALKASEKLEQQLNELGDSCSLCHKAEPYPKERILGKATLQRFEKLKTNISEGKVKDSQELMGKIAVTVCARCHNTHRIISDLRHALLPEE